MQHPYGLAYDSAHDWWLFTTQDTSSLFVFSAQGQPLSLDGMTGAYPGSVLTLSNNASDLSDGGLRAVAVDAQLGLVFVAAESLSTVLVLDSNGRFENLYNISLGREAARTRPISLVLGAPYFEATLFVTDRASDEGVYAVRYDRQGYSLRWRAQANPMLSHATGLAVAADSLFVISQGKRTILRYSPFTGRYIGQVVHFGMDNPSGIITHRDIGKVTNPVFNRVTLGEQLLYIPAGKLCTVT